MWTICNSNSPEAATSETGLCCSCAMKPTTEKITKPANIDVDELTVQTIRASLVVVRRKSKENTRNIEAHIH